MPLAMMYWLLMFLWLIGGLYWGSTTAGPGRYPVVGGSLVLFLLLLVIGLKLFGAPIHG